ncbi:DEAD/DEAH box helicase [Dactylosporangium sp. CA-092794]|uniref:DEAD/DEAH box helicase n=1 Tax=Dactylosporangium sp. CA-092794 TaxID=3239929 RepID=UPI003D93F0A4
MHSLLSRYLRIHLDNAFAEDWARQRRTAEDIVRRLWSQSQEGVVLADQVGMGKTFVALAVAATTILGEPELGQVVVFAPANVAEKWVNEWNKFAESLLTEGAPELRCVPAALRSGEDLLKALDDPPERRHHLVVVTHQALTASLKDTFIHLALAYYATRHRTGAAEVRARIVKSSTGKTGLMPDARFTPLLVERLLARDPGQWASVWQRHTGIALADEPVPGALMEVAEDLDLSEVWAALLALPKNSSPNIQTRLRTVRRALNEATQGVWKQVLTRHGTRRRLLVVDEAHALKNNGTLISRLFTPKEGNDEDGALQGIFERILLLTATPFELGHDELINILRRLTAVVAMEPPPRENLDDRLARLRERLQRAQETAIAFDESWSKLGPDDVAAFDRWSVGDPPPADVGSTAVRRAWRDAQLAVAARRAMHEELRVWVIRHERPPGGRRYRSGGSIVPGHTSASGGLAIRESDALPFLLAARAQAVAADAHGAARPHFAYGIASSYETYLRLDTAQGPLDSDAEPEETSPDHTPAPGEPGPHPGIGSPAQWYHDEITRLLASDHRRAAHPKIAATVERAVDLWQSGRKCLIFCWYIRTTAALEAALRSRIDDLITKHAADALKVDVAGVDTELLRLSQRLLRRDTSSYATVHGELRDSLREAADGRPDVADALAEAAIRNLRTGGFLVRYTRLSPELDADGLLRGISGANPIGVNLLGRWQGFAARTAAMTDSQRTKMLTRLLGELPDEGETGRRGASLSPVRRAYGETRREDRERLISVFNTPFAPDILVASSVMGEGIDLHHECRHVIHHDLDWNPSKLEQRTGRLDRIGSLAAREGAKIEVYEPYLAGTHDEKMFRVVKDRAGWFDIVMGRAGGSDETATDLEENRIALHEHIRQALSMDLRSPAPPPAG